MKARGNRRAHRGGGRADRPTGGRSTRGEFLMAYPQWAGRGSWSEESLFEPQFSFYPSKRDWGLLPGGLQLGQNRSETSLKLRGKGALLALRTQARRKITYQAALSMLV